MVDTIQEWSRCWRQACRVSGLADDQDTDECNTGDDDDSLFDSSADKENQGSAPSTAGTLTAQRPLAVRACLHGWPIPARFHMRITWYVHRPELILSDARCCPGPLHSKRRPVQRNVQALDPANAQAWQAFTVEVPWEAVVQSPSYAWLCHVRRLQPARRASSRGSTRQRRAPRSQLFTLGSDLFLAAVHRDHPDISLVHIPARSPAQTVPVLTYESVGVFVDGKGTACLPILATLPGGEGSRPLLLYRADLVSSKAEACKSGQWLVDTEGRGNFLQQLEDGSRTRITEFGEAAGTPDVPYRSIVAMSCRGNKAIDLTGCQENCDPNELESWQWVAEERRDVVKHAKKTGDRVAGPLWGGARHPLLAAIHQDRPALCVAWPEEDSDGEPLEDTEDGPLIQTFTVKSYDSGGAWLDRNFQPCLPVRVHWDDDDASILMLYPGNRRRTTRGIQAVGEWALRSAGAGTMLEARGAAGIVVKGQLSV